MKFNKIEWEDALYDYIKSIYDGKVVRNDLSVLKDDVLEIYIPDKKIAIQFCPLEDYGFDRNVKIPFQDFAKKFESKRIRCHDLGIRLIGFRQTDPYCKNTEIIKTFVKDLLLPKKRIYARQCEVRIISKKEAQKFMKENHLYGSLSMKEKDVLPVSLFYKDELVGCAIFHHHDVYENICARLAFKAGYQVVGGFDKILKHYGLQCIHRRTLLFFDGPKNLNPCFYLDIPKELKFRERRKLNKMIDYWWKLGLYQRDPQTIQYCADVFVKAGGRLLIDRGCYVSIFNKPQDVKIELTKGTLI